MKTGVDMLQNEDKFDDAQLDFLRKSVSIMKVLTEEALKTSEKFCKSCGRKVITGTDMYYALMFEAHEFFKKDIDDRYFQELEIEKNHSYDTEESEEDSEEDSEEETINEVYSVECKIASEKDFHSKILEYSANWRDWFPEDPVQQLIKRSIDNTKEQTGMQTFPS